MKPSLPRPGSSWLVFAWFALFYALCTSGQVYSPDGVVMGRVAMSIVHGQGLAVDPQGIPEGFLFPGADGRMYPKYGAGVPLVSVPFAGAGTLLAALAPASSVDLFTRPKVLWYRPRDPASAWNFFALAFVPALLIAGACGFLHAFLLRLGVGAKPALGVTLVAGLGSPLWPYAKDYFAEPLAVTALMGFAWALSVSVPAGGKPGPSPGARTGRVFLAGFLLGLTALAKVAHFVLFPAALVPLVPLYRSLPRERRLPLAGAFAAGVLLPCLVILWYNLVRFGSVTHTGYEWELDRWSTPVMTGIAGLLLSPGHGLLPYFPAALLAGATTRVSYRRWPAWTLFSWISLALLVGLYCRWYAWYGGWCYGPRFLILSIPFLAFLLVPFLEKPPRSPVLRGLGYAALAAGLWSAFAGTLVPTTEFHQHAYETLRSPDWAGRLWWDWTYFPAWSYLSFSPKIFYLLPRLLQVPSGAGPAFFFGVGIIGLVPLTRAAWRSAVGETPAFSSRERLLWPAAGIGAGILLAVLSWNSGPRVLLDFDFEGSSYGRGWSASGAAFGSSPARSPAAGRQILGGFGGGLVNTALAGDAAAGILRSPEFPIRGNVATFMIGGARDSVSVRLLVEGRPVLSATGSGTEVLARQSWDLSPYQGRRAVLELEDGSATGHLLFDDFRMWSRR